MNVQGTTPVSLSTLKASDATSSAADEKKYEAALQKWVKDSPAGNNEQREIAAARLMSCLNTQYRFLDLRGLNLSALPELPPNITYLITSNNQLTCLPTLPAGLEALYTDGNPLTALPELPKSLQILNVANCQLTTLPTLPNTLGMAIIHSNPQLTYSADSFPLTRFIDDNFLSQSSTASARPKKIEPSPKFLDMLRSEPETTIDSDVF